MNSIFYYGTTPQKSLNANYLLEVCLIRDVSPTKKEPQIVKNYTFTLQILTSYLFHVLLRNTINFQ